MSIPEQTIERRLQQFQVIARKAGVKLTHQRMEIFREIASSIEHPSAETIYTSIKKKLPSMSLDTVYRTLWLLHDLGLITTLGARRENMRFDANMERHHHFVCTRCGFVRDFTSEELNTLKIPNSVHQFGHIESTHVEVRGICETCSKDPTEQSVPKNPQPPRGKKGERHD